MGIKLAGLIVIILTIVTEIIVFLLMDKTNLDFYTGFLILTLQTLMIAAGWSLVMVIFFVIIGKFK